MKLIKFGIIMAVAALVLGAFSSRAATSIGIVTNYSKLNISIVITTNGPSTSTSKATTYTIGSAKLTNKELLALFANWASTSWPAGAQLVQGWDEDWDGHVLVVDGTGTNVLFDASEADSHYFRISIFYEDGPYNETENDAEPGSENYTWFNYGEFELYDDAYYLPYTYIVAYGPNPETYSESWNASDVVTKWSDSEKMNANWASWDDAGDLYWLDNDSYITVSGTVDSSGQGKSNPWYLRDF